MNKRYLSQRGQCRCDRLVYYRTTKKEVVYICDECGDIYRLDKPLICKKCRKPIFDVSEEGTCVNCERKAI